MTRHYVDSTASGANDGTSWPNAWTSAASSSGVAAGDEVLVADGHSETGLGAISWASGTPTNPVRIVSVDKATDLPSPGASVAITGSNIAWTGNILFDGLRVTSAAGGAGLTWGGSQTGVVQRFRNVTFVATGASSNFSFGSSSTRCVFDLLNCTIDASGGSSSAVTVTIGTSNNVFRWEGGTYTCRSTQTNLFALAAVTGLRARIAGVTFTGTVTNLFSGNAAAAALIDIIGCVAPTYTNVFGTAPTTGVYRVSLQGFVSGTLTAPLLPPTQVLTLEGTVSASLSRYRTGGADDGAQANAYSWEMASNANAADFVAALESPPITRWVETGSQTVTVYVASGVTLQDDEFWIEVTSPSEAGSPTAQATVRSTRAAILATPANLTTDSGSTWNGSGVGTKQQVSVSIAPAVAGPVVVRAYLAKASTTVYVDPKLDVA